MSEVSVVGLITGVIYRVKVNGRLGHGRICKLDNLCFSSLDRCVPILGVVFKINVFGLVLTPNLHFSTGSPIYLSGHSFSHRHLLAKYNNYLFLCFFTLQISTKIFQ